MPAKTETRSSWHNIFRKGGALSLLLNAILLLSVFALGLAFAHQRCWPLGTGCLAADAGTKPFATYAKDKYWGEKLREGGYILHFRHAKRENWHDVSAFDAVEALSGEHGETTSFKRGVCLTDQGIEEAKLIGRAFAISQIGIDQVLSSPSCRARQTAMYAFGKIDRIRTSLLQRTAVMVDQHREFAADLRKLIDSLRPAPSTNSVLVGHGTTIGFDKTLVVDLNETGNDLDNREETGFVVLERKDGKLIARHTFNSIRRFVNATIRLPLEDLRLARE